MNQVIDSFEWMKKMHHNCCSLSSLNYVLLARAQVNNTSSVYCSAQPCRWKQWLTKERGNLQFVGSGSQEVANSNYVSKKRAQENFTWHSVKLIKAEFAFSAWFKIVPLGRLCVCDREGGWWEGSACTVRSEVSFPGGILQPAVLRWGKGQSTRGTSGSETSSVRHGPLWEPALEWFSLACLFPKSGVPCSVKHEVLPYMVRRLFLF